MHAECPLCGFDCRSDDHLRQHLHVGHRKSQLIERLLDARDGGTSRATATDRPRVEAD